MTSRPTCPDCHFPRKTCICDALVKIENRHKIIVLQHPSEVKHAKGSVKVLNLCLGNIAVHVGETEADFNHLRLELLSSTQPCYLVYPDENSQMIESCEKPMPDSTLVFIDGSWKKAYKILKLNPWLEQLSKLGFAQLPKSQYRIRKASRADSLSTLEAAGYCLEQLEDCDTTGLYKAFEALIDSQWQFMSDEVKKRYDAGSS